MSEAKAGREAEVGTTLTRLQVFMGVLWLAFLAVWLIRKEWHAASILTLTVAAAIVQLRWLAAQVSDIVSLTLESAENTVPEAVVHAIGGSSPTESVATENGLEPHGQEDSKQGSQENALIDHASEDPGDLGRGREVSVPRLFTIVTLRPALLMLGACGLFYVGRSEPLALAAGVLTLPMSLMLEAIRSAIRASKTA